MYKILKNFVSGTFGAQRALDNSIIPFDPANTDYQQFKLDIINGAELQDADGQAMTAEQVQAFMETLP